jgi:hypothetical protein
MRKKREKKRRKTASRENLKTPFVTPSKKLTVEERGTTKVGKQFAFQSIHKKQQATTMNLLGEDRGKKEEILKNAVTSGVLLG